VDGSSRRITPPIGECSLVRACERGVRFLLASQGRDGLWRDFLTPAGEASQWPTGFIGTALHLACAPADPLQRAGNALLAGQNADGGWGYNEAVPSDADSTAWVLLFLTHLGRRGAACDRAASCLISHQRAESGGIATYFDADPIRGFMGMRRWVPFWGWCSPHTEVTAVAARALAASAPARCATQGRAAWDFVRSRQRADGSWSSYWWTSPHYTTLQAVQLALSIGNHNAVSRAVDWAIRTQDDDGGWGAAHGPRSFATALSLSILLHANAAAGAITRGVQRLVALQQADGGWPSHPIMRIPLPADRDPNGEGRWRLVRFSGGLIIADQHRTFTSAACLAALARARIAGFA
jgi:squalene cyclase